MRNLAIYLAGVAVLSQSTSALGPATASFRDLLAYPKYEVQFLNDLPLSESDAQRCKREGGAADLEDEDAWWNLRLPQGRRQRLSDGKAAPPSIDRPEVLPMNLRNPDSEAGSRPEEYLCLLPSKNRTMAQSAEAQRQEEEDEVELDPAESWQALSHLKGKCLYSRQGWFTYSYCHDSHIRQFREARHTHPHPPGGYVPEEDRSFDAYTLGQARGPHSARKSKAALPPGHTSSTLPGQAGADDIKDGQTSLNRADQAQRRTGTAEDSDDDDSYAVTYGSGVGTGGPGTSSRYLLQKWSDGTRCDKTGRPREIEVQVHCSMTTMDMIYLVRELAICSYVMIIHSPHLCSLPGFRAEGAAEVPSAPILCRRVLADQEWEEWVNGGAATRQEDHDPWHALTAGDAETGGAAAGARHGKTAVERALEGAAAVRAQGDLLPDKDKLFKQLGLGGLEGKTIGIDDLKALAGGESLTELVMKALEAMAEGRHHEDRSADADAKAPDGQDGDMEDVVVFTMDGGEGGEGITFDFMDLHDEPAQGQDNALNGQAHKREMLDTVKRYLKQEKDKREDKKAKKASGQTVEGTQRDARVRGEL